MKKLLIVLAIFASVNAASSQTKPAQKKESCEMKKECSKKGDKPACCSPTSKAKAISSAKKAETGKR